MITKSVSRRRFLLSFIGVSAIGMVAQNAYSGDFRYEPRSEEYWPRNMVRAIQTRLNELGIDPGPIDGLYGPKTRGAIMEFQQSRDLDVDGKISNQLIQELDLG